MTNAETERLLAEMEALPEYHGWSFAYEYPGYFCYHHDDLPYSVFFTPDWEGEESMPLEVPLPDHAALLLLYDGRIVDDHCDRLPLPYKGRTGQVIFELVRPTLDKLLMRGAPSEG